MLKILNKRTLEYLQDLLKPFTTECDLRDKANKVALAPQGPYWIP